MKEKKPYEPPKIVDLQVDYTQAVGQSRCVVGPTASGQCSAGNVATVACAQGPSATPQNCRSGATAINCNYGKSP